MTHPSCTSEAPAEDSLTSILILTAVASFPVYIPPASVSTSSPAFRELRTRAWQSIQHGNAQEWLTRTLGTLPESLDSSLALHLDGTANLALQRSRAATWLLMGALEERRARGTSEEIASTLNNLAIAWMYERELGKAWACLTEASSLWVHLPTIYVNLRTVADVSGDELWKAEAWNLWTAAFPDWSQDELLAFAYEGDRVHAASIH